MITTDQAMALVKQAEPIGLLQSHVEAAQFALFVANVVKPQHLLEIGTCSGGNLYLMHLAALVGGAPEGLRLSIDMPWSARDPNVYGHEQRFKDVLPQVVEVIGNSHDPDTLQRVKEGLQNGEPDRLGLVYIDADHTYLGAKQDFETYSPLVVPGGYVAFHDCSNGWDCGRFVREELFPIYEHWLFEEPANLFGIGVIRLPE